MIFKNNLKIIKYLITTLKIGDPFILSLSPNSASIPHGDYLVQTWLCLLFLYMASECFICCWHSVLLFPILFVVLLFLEANHPFEHNCPASPCAKYTASFRKWLWHNVQSDLETVSEVTFSPFILRQHARHVWCSYIQNSHLWLRGFECDSWVSRKNKDTWHK